MGVRYGNLSSASGLENLPPAARALVQTSVCLFQAADRGLVRNSNDKTVDHRTSCFRDWLCDPCGYSDVGQLAHLRELEIILLLGAFLDFVATKPYDAKGSLCWANTVSTTYMMRRPSSALLSINHFQSTWTPEVPGSFTPCFAQGLTIFENGVRRAISESRSLTQFSLPCLSSKPNFVSCTTT